MKNKIRKIKRINNNRKICLKLRHNYPTILDYRTLTDASGLTA